MIPLVTLTTDFGTASGYVAEVKGAFFRRLLAGGQGGSPPGCSYPLIDLAHDLPPHDVTAAAWFVASSCFGFPPGTLHVVVIDPGVGTDRPIVWAEIGDQQFLSPDNGLLSLAVARHGLRQARQVPVPGFSSATFHGRDVFAPTAAGLVTGDSSALGSPVDELVSLPWPQPRETPAGLCGEVIHVDHFGNLITNLPASLLPRLQRRVGSTAAARRSAGWWAPTARQRQAALWLWSAHRDFWKSPWSGEGPIDNLPPRQALP